MIIASLEKVMTTAYEKRYANLQGRSLLNVAQGHDDPLATNWKRPVIDSQGSAELWTDRAQDPRRVNASLSHYETGAYKTFANSYFYSTQELKVAERDGVALDPTLANAARRAHEEKLEEIILNGGGVFTNGLLNYTGQTSNAAAAAWNTLTGDELVDALHYTAEALADGSNEILAPDTLLLPRAAYRLLRMRRSASSDVTVLQAFLAESDFIRTVRPLRALAGLTYGIAYNKADEEMTSLIMPADFTQTPIDHPRGMLVECTMTVGGVFSAHPASIHKITGIL